MMFIRGRAYYRPYLSLSQPTCVEYIIVVSCTNYVSVILDHSGVFSYMYKPSLSVQPFKRKYDKKTFKIDAMALLAVQLKTCHLTS